MEPKVHHMDSSNVRAVTHRINLEPDPAGHSDLPPAGRSLPGWTPLSTAISSHLPFSPAVEANGFVFVSGQASVDDTGTIVPGTFDEEMGRAMANVESVLASAGLTLRDVVRVTSYLQNADDGPRYNELYRQYFAAPFPARTTISNCLPAALKFEVDVIAVRPG